MKTNMKNRESNLVGQETQGRKKGHSAQEQADPGVSPLEQEPRAYVAEQPGQEEQIEGGWEKITADAARDGDVVPLANPVPDGEHAGDGNLVFEKGGRLVSRDDDADKQAGDVGDRPDKPPHLGHEHTDQAGDEDDAHETGRGDEVGLPHDPRRDAYRQVHQQEGVPSLARREPSKQLAELVQPVGRAEIDVGRLGECYLGGHTPASTCRSDSAVCAPFKPPRLESCSGMLSPCRM